MFFLHNLHNPINGLACPVCFNFSAKPLQKQSIFCSLDCRIICRKQQDSKKVLIPAKSIDPNVHH